ncbi:acetyl-CoA carboxylase biotin carboxyl carrier protein subunit [Geoglobus acetivorans]|uniref:Methylmalonyl-CoA decarboxylase, subunit gamma n=1 Tax=Geoglobus acetivorans TaxID=565033 RepID=A0A0A7GFX0_GEOAI|nr:methylmalonyl-CoA decarboxylase, subunit gamma [Geoglobus acetivorans]
MARYAVTVNGRRYDVHVEEIAPGKFRVNVNGKEEVIEMVEERKQLQAAESQVSAAPVKAAGGEVKAEMSGTVVRILVKNGDEVKKGQPLLILEAMKMENEIVSPFDGTVAGVEVNEGAKVQAGDVLVRIDTGSSSGQGVSPGGSEKLDGNLVKAEMSGTIVRILRNEGQEVRKGEPVLVLEAMKMENEIVSPSDGRLSKILVKEGDRVQAGSELFVVS